MDEIEGFREYLKVAEAERLNFENPPEKTPETFEEFLPMRSRWMLSRNGVKSLMRPSRRLENRGVT